MLIPLDDTLLHQHPTPFGQVSTSDKRWFDRMMYGVIDPQTGVSMGAGLGYYINTNVADGFGAVILGERQGNVRVSRKLRPDLTSMSVRGLSVSVIEGLRRIHLAMDPARNSLGLGFEIEWTAAHPPWLEPPHFAVHEGRVISDHRRFNQVGRASGWVSLEGERIELSPLAHAVRDHSWGVRPGMGGYENEPDSLAAVGLAVWMLFSVGGRHGYVSAAYMPDGALARLHGSLGDIAITGCEHELAFLPDTRRISQGRLTLSLATGERLELEMDPAGAPMNEQGWGYQHGWLDRQSMGVPRGDAQEDDLWDLAQPGAPRSLSHPDFPAQARNWDQPVRLRCGDEHGAGWAVIFVPGRFAPYGFAA